MLPVSECSDISPQVTGQTCRCPLCCREGLQTDFAEVNSELVHGVDKVCSCLPQVLCGKKIEVSQNRAQHMQITTIHGNPRVAESVYLLVCNKDKGAKMKLWLTAHDVFQMHVLLRVAMCCILVAVFPKAELCSFSLR